MKNNQNPLCTCLIIILTIRVRKLEKTFIGRLLNMNMKLLYYSLSHVTYEIVQEIATLARTPVAIKTPFLFLLPLQFRKVILSLSHTKYICLLCHSLSLVHGIICCDKPSNKCEGPYYFPWLLGSRLTVAVGIFSMKHNPFLQVVIIEHHSFPESVKTQ